LLIGAVQIAWIFFRPEFNRRFDVLGRCFAGNGSIDADVKGGREIRDVK